MRITREKFNELTKEELVILINQKLNDDHLKECNTIETERSLYKNWTIAYVLNNKAKVLNESLIKIID